MMRSFSIVIVMAVSFARLGEALGRPASEVALCRKRADCSAYGSLIHEAREMQLLGLGQYAHGNQPIQHMIYLYDAIGEKAVRKRCIAEVVDRCCRPTPDGCCGDEDNGQTSAWYVWSALGTYPVCPVDFKWSR